MVIREFEVGKNMIKKRRPICNEKFKENEKIILCPIQASKKGWINAVAIPIHTKCYWVEKEE